MIDLEAGERVWGGATGPLLVVGCQKWPAYSWLEWRRNSNGFSWSSCRRWRQPLGGRRGFNPNGHVRTDRNVKAQRISWVVPCSRRSCVFFFWNDTCETAKPNGVWAYISRTAQAPPTTPLVSLKWCLSDKTAFHLRERLHASPVCPWRLFFFSLPRQLAPPVIALFAPSQNPVGVYIRSSQVVCNEEGRPVKDPGKACEGKARQGNFIYIALFRYEATHGALQSIELKKKHRDPWKHCKDKQVRNT